MNQLLWKHTERLAFAAGRLAKDIHIMRKEAGIVKLYAELYAARERRLRGVTRDRIALNRWARKNPNATESATLKALKKLNIATTREELCERIKSCERNAIRMVRNGEKFSPASWVECGVQDPRLGEWEKA